MKSSLLRLAALVSALLIAMGPHAVAEVSAQGTPEVAHVEVRNASLAEVLKALHEAYGLAYRSDVSLDARVSGTYDGPLSQVVARLLDGTSYILTKSGSNLRVVIVAGAGSQPIPPVAAMPAPMPSDTSHGQAVQSPRLPPGLSFPPPGPPAPSARGK